MAKKKEAETSAFDLQMPIDMSAILQLQQNSFQTLGEMHQMFISGTTTCNEELLKFLNRRYKEDLETYNQFANCTKPQDVYTVYSQFLQKAMAQYMEEAERISSIGSKVMGDAMKIAEKSSDSKPNGAKSGKSDDSDS